MAMNKHDAVEEQLEAMFSLQSVQLYSDDHREKLASHELEIGFRGYSLYQATSSDDIEELVFAVLIFGVCRLVKA
jgi:hypothetical protein